MTLQEVEQPRIIRLRVKATGDEIRTNNVGGALIGLMKGVYALVDDPVSQDLIDELMGRKPSIPLSLGERSEMSFEDSKMFPTNVKNLIAPKIAPGGYAICCGWNSIGLGKERGFKLLEVLLVCHGGRHNDTIVTVEQKINGVIS